MRQPDANMAEMNKRQRIERVALDPEQLGLLWKDIFRLARPRMLIKLASTCRFFNTLVREFATERIAKGAFQSEWPLHSSFADEPLTVYWSMALQRCFLCHKHTMALRELIPIYQCRKCRGRDARTLLISPTEAKRSLFLNPEDLHGLRHSHYQNEYGVACRTFLRCDVEKRANLCIGAEELSAMQRKARERQAKRQADAEQRQRGLEQRRQLRRDQVASELEERGLAAGLLFHHFCQSYIYWGQPSWDVILARLDTDH